MDKNILITIEEVLKKVISEVEGRLGNAIDEGRLKEKVDRFMRVRGLVPTETVGAEKYIVCSMSCDYIDFEMDSFEDLEDVESFIRSAGCQTVVFLNGKLIEYGFYQGITWVDPLFTIKYKLNEVEDEVHIHRRYLEEKAILQVLKQGASNVKAYNHHNQVYDDFYVIGLIYDTQDTQSDPIFRWTDSESIQEDIDEDINDYAANEERCRFFLDIAEEDNYDDDIEEITTENE